MNEVKRVGILGAAGLIGQQFIQSLRDHPQFEIAALVDVRAGEPYGKVARWRFDTQIPESVADLTICDVNSPLLKDVDLVFSGLPGDVAGPIEAELARKGLMVISKAKDHRLERDIPLIVPEVNHEHLDLLKVQKDLRNWQGAIITTANCTTSILTMTLKPIHDEFRIKKISVVTMQAISGAGYPGVSSLDIMDNVIPYIGGEEEKCRVETRKILGGVDSPASIDVSATCTRVPVLDGHMEVVSLQTQNEVGIAEAKNAFLSLKPLTLHSAPKHPIVLREQEDRPQTRLDRYEGNGMSVVVGRIQKDTCLGLRYVVVGHNTIRGGAGEAVLTGELMEKRNLL